MCLSVQVISHHNDTELELGTVGSGTEKQVVFALVNENPVPVTLLSWDTSLPSATITIASIRDGNATSFLSQYCLYNDTTQASTHHVR
ncbi:hypothetical protein J6590_044954 [Homalodisca vitripennis]|nr:hypothetical protein J6590_044954 [Homalodisca vitripennis]